MFGQPIFNMLVSAYILILAINAQSVLGLLPRHIHRLAENNTDNYPQVILGPEGSDPTTTQYSLNHVTLNTGNITRAVDFYTKVFGMRVITTIKVSKHFSTTYLGYSFAGRNGTGYMTAEELFRQQRNTQGLLEIISLQSHDNDLPSSTQKTSTFSQLGFVVPDTEAIQKRLEDFGVTIYKRIGDPSPEDGPFTIATNLIRSKIEPKEFAAIFLTLSDAQYSYVFAADPDGNMIEIMPQE
ncbi:Glyoxalase/Bleomycin resistance protein/Dihydroxybiphenyl dioxygenase [Xylaria flabelliformis]|nr:Glyoxalase/Bleomycin resistance protein/Dihydroxybiphenyl dioxygenase [Xylaria flabelliformis]